MKTITSHFRKLRFILNNHKCNACYGRGIYGVKITTNVGNECFACFGTGFHQNRNPTILISELLKIAEDYEK